MSVRIFFLIGILLISFSQISADPGIRDTVKIEGGPLIVGQSVPLYFTIVNDEDIGGASLGFLLTALDSGFAIWDSAVYINRLSDPLVLPYRYADFSHGDIVHGVAPDTLVIGFTKATGESMPAGNDPIIALYFTGITSGIMNIDSTYFPPVGTFLLVNTSPTYSIYPEFVNQSFEIIEATFPPVLSVTSELFQEVAGSNVSFNVAADSPENFPIVLSIVSLVGYDDETLIPTNSPTMDSESPTTFNWLTTSNDVGIWKVTIQACDSAGVCVTNDVEIQIVESSSYITDFSMSELIDIMHTLSLSHSDFNNDGYQEIFLAGAAYNNSNTAECYTYEAGNNWLRVFEHPISGYPKTASQSGFFDSGSSLDVLVMGFPEDGSVSDWRTYLFSGDGDNTFNITGSANDGHVTRSSAIGEFTGNNQLDVACTWDEGVYIYSGDGQAGFQFFTLVNTINDAKSVNSADFNADGYDDLAVGTTEGVEIYLNNGTGSFSFSASYPQTYGSLNIEITNKGSDFNNDGVFDLCISTPSIGGVESEMVIYLGNGDGTFTQNSIRTVKGQIFGNCVGDFNNDNELDIAFTNGAKRYVAILFGDGDGAFTNEIRYQIPHINPQFIDCFDLDLDGDLDIVILAQDITTSNSIFTLLNTASPEGISKRSVVISAEDNVEVELSSPSGKQFSKIRNTMSTGEFYNNNSNQNNIMDSYLRMDAVESGEYILKASPKLNLEEGENFSVEFKLDGESYRLAKDISMSSSGYDFAFYPNSSSDILPSPGKFIVANPPTFIWQGTGQFDFQLDDQIDFSSPLFNLQVSGSSYIPSQQLVVSDTTTYYWRVKQHAQAEYDCIFTINLVASENPGCGDVDSNFDVELPDVIYLINYIFVGGLAPSPIEIGDADCSGAVDISDAVYLINFLYGGGFAPCALCP